MDKDPRLLKDEEVDKIVEVLRVAYYNWDAEEKKAAMEEKKPKRSAGVSKEKATKLSLDDLEI